MRKSIPWYKILRATIPVIRATLKGLYDAVQEDSQGGRRITRDELRELVQTAFDAAVDEVVSKIEDALKR